MWSVISAPVNELTPVCISGGILDLSVCPLTANPCPGTVDSYVDAQFGMLVTPNMLYRLFLLSRIFGWKDIKRLRQRPHFFVSLSHFLFLWREGSWCSSISVSPRWLYCPFSQSYYRIVSSASCVLSPPLVVQWNLGIFLCTPPHPHQVHPELPKVTVGSPFDVIFVHRPGWQAGNRAVAPVIKVKEDFTLDYTELYTGSYDCNQTHCWRDMEVSSCCKCQCFSNLICRQLSFSLGGGGWVVSQLNKMPAY